MKKCFSILKKVGLGLIVLLFLLACAGALYQSISTKLEEKQYPPPGSMVDVGGYRLHLHNMGTGGPTVVLDAGLGSIGVDWGLVQPEIAKFTHVVSYDRAGTGWSERGPHPRTSAQIVQELHTLLHTAEVPGPYIFVGASFGGANVQLFASAYPEEVLGIVLVDSCHEAQLRRLPPSPLDGRISLMQKPMVMRIATTLGIFRLLSNLYMKEMMPSLPRSLWNTRQALCSTTKSCCTVSAEASSLPLSLKQLEEADQSAFRDKSCIVITAGLLPDFSLFPIDGEYLQEFHRVWNELQKELVVKFRDGRQMIAENSDHIIQLHQPEIIVQAVQELVKGSKQEMTND